MDVSEKRRLAALAQLDQADAGLDDAVGILDEVAARLKRVQQRDAIFYRVAMILAALAAIGFVAVLVASSAA